jgi:PIN domain nuclease of toxin-antitoxin system
LQLDVPLDQMIQTQQAANDLQILPVELHHVYVLNELPLHHHDSFDRLLIAQAKAEQAWLVSTDSQFEPYSVPVIW